MASITRQTVTIPCLCRLDRGLSTEYASTSGVHILQDDPHIWNTSQGTILQQMPQFTHNSTLKKNQQIHPAIYAATYSETPINHNAQTGAVYIHHCTLFIGVSSAQSHTPTHDFLKNYHSFRASRTSN